MRTRFGLVSSEQRSINGHKIWLSGAILAYANSLTTPKSVKNRLYLFKSQNWDKIGEMHIINRGAKIGILGVSSG